MLLASQALSSRITFPSNSQVQYSYSEIMSVRNFAHYGLSYVSAEYDGTYGEIDHLMFEHYITGNQGKQPLELRPLAICVYDEKWCKAGGEFQVLLQLEAYAQDAAPWETHKLSATSMSDSLLLDSVIQNFQAQEDKYAPDIDRRFSIQTGCFKALLQVMRDDHAYKAVVLDSFESHLNFTSRLVKAFETEKKIEL